MKENLKKQIPRILIDAMGGDHAPLEILKGAVSSVKTFADQAEICLVGKEAVIQKLALSENLDLSGISLYDAHEVIAMDEAPIAVRKKKDSSLRVGLDLLAKGEVDAFVSAGSTGALHTGATLFVKRIPGIQRAAIASILPLKAPLLLIDSGANTSVNAEHLRQFAVMGSAYMEAMFGIEKPRVGLLNIGEEPLKGTDLQRDTYTLLENDPDIHFIGNVEGKAVPFDVCDVLVTEGFSGNILLKTVEGMASFFSGEIKGLFTKNFFALLGAPLYLRSLKSLRRRFDPSEHGGAPILGAAKPVIKAHGSSDAKAIESAVRQAIRFTTADLTAVIETRIQERSTSPSPISNPESSPEV